MDWFAALDMKKALGNCHSEFPGDWYRDPWGWPELDWVVEHGRELLTTRLGREGACSVAKIDVPKENYSTRPAIVLDPLDRLVYQALVDRLSIPLIGDLHRGVYGWRLPVREPEPGLYSPNSRQWERFRDYLGLLAATYQVALKTDVVSCFASVPFDVLETELIAEAPGGKPLDRLLSMLRHWQNVPGRAGLPQRSLASSIIANMLLMRVDDLLVYYSKRTRWTILGTAIDVPHSFARWMDDIWLFGNDAGDLRRAQIEIQNVLREIGLNLNIGKTELLEGEGEVEAATLELEHSAVDDGLAASPMDTQPLEEVLEKITRERERAHRTEVRFVSTRIRDHGLYAYVDRIVDVAARIPQGADHLARLFRSAGRASDLEGWYLEFTSSAWGKLEWAVAQFGTMFPSRKPPGKAVQDFFAAQLAGARTSLPMTALCADRLAQWSPNIARVVLAEAISRIDNPLQRRILALAALQAGHSRTIVRKWLGELDENLVTLRMLESTNFKVPRRKPDFKGTA